MPLRNLAVELQAPDISPWRAGNTGVPWVHQLHAPAGADPAGAAPGPQVMVQALTHGNEICGAIALNWLLGEITAGRWQQR